MNKSKNKARSTAATVKRASGKAALDRAAISYPHCSTILEQRQTRIANLLSYGRNNAIPLRQLEAIADLDGRTVRSMIAAERMRGAPILSDNSSGYYLPANAEEKAQFVRSMRHRAKEILRAADAVEKA